MEKVIAIVGMGGGISYAVALRFGRAGYKIGMIARNEEKLKVFKEMLFKDGIPSEYYTADVSVQSQLTNAFRDLKSDMGDPEVLHYNAAKIKNKHILKESIASIAADIKVNVGGALHSVKQVVRPMKKANKGTILITGGGLSQDPHPNYGSLSIGKAAVLNLAQQLGKELADTNIKVGTVVVNGYVQAKDLKYNPTMIADEFWKIHTDPYKDFSLVEY
ncbi:SDR family NAD(P)-dependent oxidoreductase [Marinoscillum pacificum]|uniref:SDR family NAD(P)-dependent oxidoreductase n=1 Tax=Marinoscillum pacificum TaxID=392723 RepID=UPI002157EB44|nr:SDR family NAD(P)-dependent oxidoreductase [Marinoscillum pacificum]